MASKRSPSPKRTDISSRVSSQDEPLNPADLHEYHTYYREDTDFLHYGPRLVTGKEECDAKPSISGVAFCGGGAKGVAYCGVVDVLHAMGILDSITKMSGSSAGAITATLLACISKIATVELREQAYLELINDMKTTNFQEFLDVSYSAKAAKGLKPNFTLNPVQAKSTLGKVGSALLVPIHTVFQVAKLPLAAPVALAAVTGAVWHNGLAEGNAFLIWLEMMLRRYLSVLGGKKPDGHDIDDDYVPTFRDFHAITGVNLVVTATCLETGRTVYFGSGTTPDVFVSHAVRASMAFPGLFQPMTIDKLTYIDGGCYDNYPIRAFDVFHHDHSLVAYNCQMIGFIIREKVDPVQTVLKGVKATVGVLAGLHDALHKERQAGAPYWLRTCAVPCFYGPYALTTTNFDVDPDSIEPLAQVARSATINFIEWIRFRMCHLKRMFPTKELVYTSDILAKRYRDGLAPILEAVGNPQTAVAALTKFNDEFSKSTSASYEEIFSSNPETYSDFDLLNSMFRQMDALDVLAATCRVLEHESETLGVATAQGKKKEQELHAKQAEYNEGLVKLRTLYAQGGWHFNWKPMVPKAGGRADHVQDDSHLGQSSGDHSKLVRVGVSKGGAKEV